MTIFYFYAFLFPIIGICSGLVVCLGGFSLCGFVKKLVLPIFQILSFWAHYSILDTMIHYQPDTLLQSKIGFCGKPL